MKFRYKHFSSRPITIRVFKFVWQNYFRDCKIIRLTSWRGAKVSRTFPEGGGVFEHVTACPKWAPWLI